MTPPQAGLVMPSHRSLIASNVAVFSCQIVTEAATVSILWERSRGMSYAVSA